MANTIAGGSTVKAGYYLNAARWHVEPIEKDGMRLPEGRGSWMKVPTVAALVLVPLLGLTFLMFLPFIGFVLFLEALAKPLVRGFRSSAAELAATVSPGWTPGEAHLTGKSPENAGVEEKGPIAKEGERLEALRKEIEEKRNS